MGCPVKELGNVLPPGSHGVILVVIGRPGRQVNVEIRDRLCCFAGESVCGPVADEAHATLPRRSFMLSAMVERTLLFVFVRGRVSHTQLRCMQREERCRLERCVVVTRASASEARRGKSSSEGVQMEVCARAGARQTRA